MPQALFYNANTNSMYQPNKVEVNKNSIVNNVNKFVTGSFHNKLATDLSKVNITLVFGDKH